MKPGIIERLDKNEAALEETIKRIVKDSLAATGNTGGGILLGTIVPFSGDMEGPHPINPVTRKADMGYALCDGQTYFSTSLGGMIETPDLRNRFIMGSGDIFLPGEQGGSLEREYEIEVFPTTLTVAQMPAHGHRVKRGVLTSGQDKDRAFQGTYQNPSAPPATIVVGTELAGGGQAHTHKGRLVFAGQDKLVPYFVLCYLMKI